MIKLIALNKIGMSQVQIALQLGVHQSTISRELKRNIGKRGYIPMILNNALLCLALMSVSKPDKAILRQMGI